MTDKLPPNILKLFEPRPQIPQLTQLDRHPGERTGPQLSGVSAFLADFQKFPGKPVKPTKTAQELREERVL
jgi:U1 small nuclear ribonucleoprotein 70kDa